MYIFFQHLLNQFQKKQKFKYNFNNKQIKLKINTIYENETRKLIK